MVRGALRSPFVARALGPKGVVFASNRKDGDSVYAVVDSNGDHGADAVQVVASGLDTPNGIAYRNGTLFIAEVDGCCASTASTRSSTSRRSQRSSPISCRRRVRHGRL